MASTPRNDGVPTPPPTANTQSIGPLGAVSMRGRRRQGRPAQAGRLVGVLGLGDAAVQLGHPDLRLRGAVPGLRQLPARRHRGARRRRPAEGARARRALERLRARHDSRRHPDPAARPGARPARRRDRSQEGRAVPLHDAARPAAVRAVLRARRPVLLLAGRRVPRPRRRGLRDRRRQLQRDAAPGLDPAHDRQGLGPRLGPRLHRRHRRARHRGRADLRRLVRARHLRRARATG